MLFLKKDKNERNKEKPTKISPEEARKIMEEEKDILILDVRTPMEYEMGHIPGAICVPNESIGEHVKEVIGDKEKKLLVYCRSGSRSGMASKKLAKLGYTNVLDFGGILRWNYEIVK